MSEWKGLNSDKKWETVNRLMRDTVDCHINMGQDYTGMAYPTLQTENPVDRPFDDINIALKASKVGMRAIVFTCHVAPGFFRVPLIQKAVDEWAVKTGKRGVQIIGSVSLNSPMGGLNPDVVRMMIRFGGKVVCTPTYSGWYRMHRQGRPGGIELVKNGKVVPELEEIIGLIADNNLIMDTSWASPEERLIVFDEAKKAGVTKSYVFNPPRGATEDYWVELTKKGLKLMPAGNVINSRERFTQTWNLMMKAGVDNCVSGSDLNNWHGSPHPVEGLKIFMIMLLNQGMSERDIEMMFKTNPAQLLNL